MQKQLVPAEFLHKCHFMNYGGLYYWSTRVACSFLNLNINTKYSKFPSRFMCIMYRNYLDYLKKKMDNPLSDSTLYVTKSILPSVLILEALRG